jgi:hypothetical protein
MRDTDNKSTQPSGISEDSIAWTEVYSEFAPTAIGRDFHFLCTGRKLSGTQQGSHLYPERRLVRLLGFRDQETETGNSKIHT